MSRTTIHLYWIRHLSPTEPYKFTRTQGRDRGCDTTFNRYTISRQSDEHKICVLEHQPVEYDISPISLDGIPITQGTDDFDICKKFISGMDNAIKTQSHKFDNFMYKHMHGYKLETLMDMYYNVHLNGRHIYSVTNGFEQQTGELQRYFNLVHPNLHALPLDIPITLRQFENLVNGRSFDNKTL